MSYIHGLDRTKRDAERVTGQGFAAEDTVVEFFERNFPNLQVRHATEAEDSGHVGQGVGSKMIDVVVSERKGDRAVPAMAIQVTTNNERAAMAKKLAEMKDMPLVNLPESRLDDPLVPRILVFLEPKDVRSYTEEKDPVAAQRIMDKIVTDSLRSLQFDLTQTKHRPHQEHIRRMMDLLEQWQKENLTNGKASSAKTVH